VSRLARFKDDKKSFVKSAQVGTVGRISAEKSRLPRRRRPERAVRFRPSPTFPIRFVASGGKNRAPRKVLQLRLRRDRGLRREPGVDPLRRPVVGFVEAGIGFQFRPTDRRRISDLDRLEEADRDGQKGNLLK